MRDSELDIRELEQLDFEVVEALDFETSCDWEGCDVTPVWLRVAVCDTATCRDNTVLFCNMHAKQLRALDDVGRLSGAILCSWCAASPVTIVWTPWKRSA